MCSCASLLKPVSFTWIKAAAGITMGPEDKNHVGCKHPPDYHGRAFPVILHSGKGRSLLLSRFSKQLCPAHSSSTWDVWAGGDGLSRSASLSALEERTFTDRLQEKTVNTDQINLELRKYSRWNRNTGSRQQTFETTGWVCVIAPGRPCAQEGRRARQRNLDFSGRLVFIEKPSTATF